MIACLVIFDTPSFQHFKLRRVSFDCNTREISISYRNGPSVKQNSYKVSDFLPNSHECLLIKFRSNLDRKYKSAFKISAYKIEQLYPCIRCAFEGCATDNTECHIAKCATIIKYIQLF